MRTLMKIRDLLLGSLPQLSGFGVYGLGLCPDEVGGKPGFTCVLYVGDELWSTAIQGARSFEYHERLVLILRKIGDLLWQYTGSNQLQYYTSELMAIVLGDPMVTESAGLTYDDDRYTVPRSNFLETMCSVTPEQVEAMTEVEWFSLMESIDTWGKIVRNPAFFDPDNDQHARWINFAFVPARPASEISLSNCLRSVNVTQMGWNLSDNRLPLGDHTDLANRLHDAVTLIEENNWLVSL